MPNSRDIFSLCGETDVLVRRFFLFDVMSGVPSTATTGSTPSYVRFAKYINLELRIYSDVPDTIYSPVLTVEYYDVDASKWSGYAGNPSVPNSSAQLLSPAT